MQVRPFFDPTTDGRGLVCRQSRVAAAISVVVFTAILSAAPIFWWAIGMPWPVWGLFALLPLLIVPLLISDLRAKLSPGNWLVWIRDDGVSINLRSYQDHGETETDAVVEFDYQEIESVSRQVERYTTPSGNGSTTQWKITSLEIRLAQPDAGELAEALRVNRHRQQPERVYLGGIRVRSGLTHYPVTLPEPDVIRIAWRGAYGNWAGPSLSKVLAVLADHVEVVEPARADSPHWQDLTDAEFDDRVLELTRSGNRIDAVTMLVRRRGLTTTEAHQFVKELAGQL